jgi:sec-independent protein translocase protein TatB
MFELSFSEILVIALVAIIFVGPKELPTVIRALSGVWRAASRLWGEMRGALNDAVEQSGLKEQFTETRKEIEQEANYIIDQNGNRQRVYNLSDIYPEFAVEEQKKELLPASDAPLPISSPAVAETPPAIGEATKP